MRALVTGCAGFIGSHLAERLLSLNYEVIGIDSFTDYYPRLIKESNIYDARKDPRFTFIEKDIMEMSEFPEVDYVFHEAAQAGVRASWGSSFSIYTRNNIETTQHLLEYYKEKDLKKFVNASSSSVYGDALLPMCEDMLPQPISPYGVSKLAAEHLCYLYWKNYKIPTISLRYFTVYGPRQRPDMGISKFVSAIQNGTPITIYGDGTQTRDFTFISDVTDANILASHYQGDGDVFNIGGGNRISVNDLIKEIEKIKKRRAIVQYIESQKGDALNTLADTTKAKKQLGWQPKVSIEEGLQRYEEWFSKFQL